MGITDGHIYFDSTLFEKGKRPAINLFLSVTRVGRQTQSKLSKDISQQITSFLAEYESLQNLAHFGAELSVELQSKLKKGSRLSELFEQDYNTIIDETSQLILIAIVWGGLFDSTPISYLQEKIISQCSRLVPLCNPEKMQFIESLDQLVDEIYKQKDIIQELL
jgi:F-type H+-transporting ATPase subunit alpha